MRSLGWKGWLGIGVVLWVIVSIFEPGTNHRATRAPMMRIRRLGRLKPQEPKRLQEKFQSKIVIALGTL